jgi:hypothetical protein
MYVVIIGKHLASQLVRTASVRPLPVEPQDGTRLDSHYNNMTSIKCASKPLQNVFHVHVHQVVKNDLPKRGDTQHLTKGKVLHMKQ